MKAFPDYLTEEQANQLAASIQQFWHNQGHPGVRVWTEKAVLHRSALDRAICFVVRSNLVRGMPQP